MVSIEISEKLNVAILKYTLDCHAIQNLKSRMVVPRGPESALYTYVVRTHVGQDIAEKISRLRPITETIGYQPSGRAHWLWH